jgi:hypothetical protein
MENTCQRDYNKKIRSLLAEFMRFKPEPTITIGEGASTLIRIQSNLKSRRNRTKTSKLKRYYLQNTSQQIASLDNGGTVNTLY